MWFFFSSRRRHTRWNCDWSSDVCSSDLVERQIEIGMWRQANVAKVGLHFESILIRGLMEYAFWTPNGSPEYRYCLHEAVEECNHTMMFQEMVNRIGDRKSVV